MSFTPENDLILAVFQLLVSGIILCGTGAVFYLQKGAFARRILGLVGCAFCLYSLHFFLRVVSAYRSLSSATAGGLAPGLDLSLQATETLALLCLALAYLPQWLPEKPRMRSGLPVGVAGVLLVGGPYLVQQQWPGGTSGWWFSGLLNGLLLAGVAAVHLGRKGWKGFFSAVPLVLLAAAQFLRATAAAAPSLPERLWGAQNAALLVGLGLFALVLDARSGNLQVRFFLRLNLIFVAIASLLILTISQTERREHLRIAESQTEELCEFLRGHLIYFHHQGLRPAEILSRPEIIRKVTSDFGRLPDLRHVRVSFLGWRMEMSIADDWTVEHEVYPQTRESSAPDPPKRERTAFLTPVPVVQGGRVLGQIELEESLRSIHAQVARQLRLIFLTFTVAVFVAAGLFGFTVRDAHRTIRRQFEELEKTHGQLAHAARLSSAGQIAGSLAHEINNPAGIILTTADYLLREARNQGLAESLREDLEAIGRQARRISTIVSGLLTFSRPTVLHKQPIQLNTVLQQSVALLAPRFREQHVEVQQQLACDLPAITADPDRLEQVFVNLLNNAADAMPRGGVVRIESAAGQVNGRRSLVVSIADTGCGIPEENLKSIFDPFFTTKPKGQGTGLGLPVSYGIIRDHGGQIAVESQAARGSMFRVCLPVRGTRDEEL